MRTLLLPFLILLAALPATLNATGGPAPARRSVSNAPAASVAPAFQHATATAQTALPFQPGTETAALAPVVDESATAQPEISTQTRSQSRRTNRLQRFASRIQQLAPSLTFFRPAASGSGIATSGRMQVANTALLIIILVVLVAVILILLLDGLGILFFILTVILLVLLILWLLKLL